MKQSATERKLLKELNKLGFYPKEQYKISRMTVDFALLEKGIIIEVDGSHHDTHHQRKADRKRDAHLQTIGWKVVRVTAEEVYEDPIKTAHFLKHFINKNKGNPKIEEDKEQTKLDTKKETKPKPSIKKKPKGKRKHKPVKKTSPTTSEFPYKELKGWIYTLIKFTFIGSVYSFLLMIAEGVFTYETLVTFGIGVLYAILLTGFVFGLFGHILNRFIKSNKIMVIIAIISFFLLFHFFN